MSDKAWILLNMFHSLGVLVWLIANVAVCFKFVMLIKHAKKHSIEVDTVSFYMIAMTSGGSAVILSSML